MADILVRFNPHLANVENMVSS